MGVTYFLLLSCLGLATTAEAQDCGRPVGGLNMHLKDEYILSETFSNGSSAIFACDVGYRSTGGSASVTCISGSWSPVGLRCEKKNCGSFGDVDHGSVDYSEGTEFGSKIVITCDDGYTFVGRPGPREIFCKDLGWSDRLPVCEVVTCDRPPANTNATLNPNKEVYNYREVVRYNCPKGLYLIGVNSITCSDTGTFEPDPNLPPVCKKIECGYIEIENADWTGGSRPPYGFRDTVIFKCRSGYVMEGKGTLECGENNEWSPERPKCLPVTCHGQLMLQNGSFTPDKNVYNYRDTVKFTCQEGFRLEGSKSVTCSEDGTFKPEPPKCSMVTCAPPMLAGGTVSPSKSVYQYKDVVQYSCPKDFTPVGPHSIMCSDDGTFKPAPPTCTMVTCAPPMLAGGTVSPSKSVYQYKDVVQYSCPKDFTPVGPHSIMCSDDGTFKPAPPKCIRFAVTVKPKVSTTTATPGNNGHRNSYVMPLVICLIVIVIGALAACGCYCFGVPAFIKKKKGCSFRSMVGKRRRNVLFLN